MKRPLYTSFPLITFMALTLIVLTPLPALTIEDTDVQEGSAGGQADVPAMEGPAADRSRVVIEAVVPDTQLRAHKRGSTHAGSVAKDRMGADKFGGTKKAILAIEAQEPSVL